MYKGKTILGIIPARGGSKGLPRKNVSPLLGKPLIAWTIEQALENPYLDRVIVSTEDKEIADISKKYGAEVPFKRPKKLATDEAKGIDVILHTQAWIMKHNQYFDALMVLQPTSPLRLTEDIQNSITLFFQRNAQSVISVSVSDKHPWWCNTLPPDNCMAGFLRPDAHENRQALPIYYCLNGAIYLIDWNFLRTNRSFWGHKTYAYIMRRENSIDIDNEFDFIFAELMLSNRQKTAQIPNIERRS